VPCEVGKEQDHDRLHGPVHDTSEQRVASGESAEIDLPGVGQQKAAPMMSAARKPRSKHTARPLGRPAAASLA
jgi:hypothetical protein